MEIVVLLIGLSILGGALFLASLLLRAAVALANRSIGPVRLERFIGWDWVDDPLGQADEDQPPPPAATAAMPEPTTGQSLRTVLLLVLLHVVQFVAMLAADSVDGYHRRQDETSFLLSYAVIGGVLGVAVLSVQLAIQLRTKWRWAVRAAVAFYLLCGGLIAAVVGLLTLVFD